MRRRRRPRRQERSSASAAAAQQQILQLHCPVPWMREARQVSAFAHAGLKAECCLQQVVSQHCMRMNAYTVMQGSQHGRWRQPEAAAQLRRTEQPPGRTALGARWTAGRRARACPPAARPGSRLMPHRSKYWQKRALLCHALDTKESPAQSALPERGGRPGSDRSMPATEDKRLRSRSKPVHRRCWGCNNEGTCHCRYCAVSINTCIAL